MQGRLRNSGFWRLMLLLAMACLGISLVAPAVGAANPHEVSSEVREEQIRSTSAVITSPSNAAFNPPMMAPSTSTTGSPVRASLDSLKVFGLKLGTPGRHVQPAVPKMAADAHTPKFETREILRITEPRVESSTETSVTVLWYTNSDADSWVYLPGGSTIGSSTLTKTHRITINNLQPNSPYELQVASADREQRVASHLTARTDNLFAWPTKAHSVSSEFGMRVDPITGIWKQHEGIDIPQSEGNPVYASRAGIVAAAGFTQSMGNFITIDHGGGIQTVHMHLSKIGVQRGQAVSRGSQIGEVGNTGASKGAHLHFEIRTNGKSVNPLGYLPAA